MRFPVPNDDPSDSAYHAVTVPIPASGTDSTPVSRPASGGVAATTTVFASSPLPSASSTRAPPPE